METANAPHKKRVGLILSGGAARGFAHIGLLRVLERADIEVDVIAGTSMGAILGAFYASGHTADDIYEIARSVTWRDLIDLSLHNGLLKGLKLHAFLASHLPETFGELQKPLVVATTDVESGEEVFIFEGDLVTAVRASSCFPGAFEPVSYQGRTLADGGIVNNLPINAVSFLHANFTIAGDATVPRRAPFSSPDEGRWWERMMATFRLERRNPMAQTLLRATDIMGSILTEVQYTMHPADLRVQYPMPHLNVESFWALEEIVAIGEWSALQVFVHAGLLPKEALEEVAPPPTVKALGESTHPDEAAVNLTRPKLHKAPKPNPRTSLKSSRE